MPNPLTYYNLTDASKLLKIRQVQLYRHMQTCNIKAFSLANMQGLFLTSENLQFIQICIRQTRNTFPMGLSSHQGRLGLDPLRRASQS